MVKWIIAAILLLPIAEIAVFVAVAAAVGLAYAFTLMLVTSLAGFLVLRQAGRGKLAHFRVAVADSDITGFEANTGGVLTVLAGLLLLLPGFITDLIGGLLLIGPVRRWCSARFRRAMTGRERSRTDVVDLTPGEWTQVPDRELENKRDKPGAR